jgi:hypothetical protein
MRSTDRPESVQRRRRPGRPTTVKPVIILFAIAIFMIAVIALREFREK